MSQNSQFDLLKTRRFAPFFVTQALGAFNDNVFRQAIIGLLGYMAISQADKAVYTQLAPAIFILPYFLFSSIAGQFAERTEKSKLIRITTAMEIAIMSLAAVGFVLQNMTVLLIALFATGVQSTLFGPVKYSILPSVLRREELTGGNGLVEMGTSISILIGMIAGGMVFVIGGSGAPWLAGALVIALAIIGNLVSRQIPPVPAAAPDLKINWNPIPESLAIWRLTRKQPAVRNSVLGVSWFWFTGTVLTGNLPVYAEANLGGTPTLYVAVLAIFSVGVGIGSLLCEKLSGRRIEIGLVPLGAFGISAFLLDLYFARPGTAAASGLNVMGFLAQPGSWRIVFDLVGIGLFSGIFVVPLFALIQSRTPTTELSRVIAGMNIQNAIFIVLAAIGGIALQRFLGWSIPQLLLALAVANILVAIWIFTVVPEFLMRFLSWIVVSTLYRIKTEGLDSIPEEGAALVVCNHVSYMDALIIGGCVRRPMRYVMYHKIFDIPVLSFMFRTVKAIPIAGAHENPELLRKAFDDIDAALAEGELVCVFPEGKLTSDGEIAAFKNGVERILERRPVPVIPTALRGLWGSVWSRRDSRLGRMRVPRRFRARIDYVVGVPISPDEATAALLEQHVKALRGTLA